MEGKVAVVATGTELAITTGPCHVVHGACMSLLVRSQPCSLLRTTAALHTSGVIIIYVPFSGFNELMPADFEILDCYLTTLNFLLLCAYVTE